MTARRGNRAADDGGCSALGGDRRWPRPRSALLFAVLKVPSPALFGGLVTGMIFALTTKKAHRPARPR